MGDRVSISFRHGERESVALFNHWGGREFVNEALDYLSALNERPDSALMPLDRKEPCYVMVDFIRWLTKDMGRVESSLYLGKDSWDGDNSDNGHYVIDLETGRFS